MTIEIDQQSKTLCPECHGTINYLGICDFCGLIIQDSEEYSYNSVKYKDQYTLEEASADNPINLLLINRIYGHRDYRGTNCSKIAKKLQYVAKVNVNSKQVIKFRIHQTIRGFLDYFELSKTNYDHIVYEYSKTLKRFVVNNHQALINAICYIFARKNGKTPAEILCYFRMKGSRSDYYRYFMNICRKYQLQIKSFTIEQYFEICLNRIEQIKYEYINEIKKEAVLLAPYLIKKMGNRSINPKNFAITIIYAASYKLWVQKGIKRFFTQERLSDIFNIPQYPIRDIWVSYMKPNLTKKG
jgi:hypothetical protein